MLAPSPRDGHARLVAGNPLVPLAHFDDVPDGGASHVLSDFEPLFPVGLHLIVPNYEFMEFTFSSFVSGVTTWKRILYLNPPATKIFLLSPYRYFPFLPFFVL